MRAVLVSLSLLSVLLLTGKYAESQPSDRIAVISSAIAAFTSIANSITSFQREDVRSVAVLLYSGKINFFVMNVPTYLLCMHTDLLKDETSEIDLVGPTFPALKALLDLPVAPGPDNKERYNRLIHALLSTCLRHIDGMR